MKILIVTAFYPPENAIAAQRPLSWANAWSESGCDVTVLTVRREGSLPPPNAVRPVRVIEISPSTLFAKLRRLYRKSAPVSTPASGSPDMISARRDSMVRRLFESLKRRGLLSSVRWPDAYDLWRSPAIRAIGSEKFDVVVSTFGPPAVIAVGWNLKRRGLAKKWVLDFRDLWTENPSFRGFPIVRFFERRAENFYLKRADAVTTVSEPLAQALRKRREDVWVFTNGYEGENATNVRKTHAKTRVIRYTGSHYWPHQDPTPLFEVLKVRLDRGRSDVVVEFYGPSLGKISELAEKSGVSSVVRVFGATSRSEALHLQSTADALLFLESPSTPGREGILTGKLFEYLAAKRPILAVGIHQQSLAGQIISECDAGVCAERDQAKIEGMISELERDALAIRPTGLPTRFSRKTIAVEMLRMIRSL